mmetsp:Transcript_22430/g.89061  ORF Transcript_22430/g.89061 Transcript_22430/m.89061 type:complete len:90 (+) Transcript_22430:95-364(+)
MAAMIKLNVGGHHFETTKTTLEKCGFFKSMFSGNWNLDCGKDDAGRIFIDRDGAYFHYLLSFCRGSLPRVRRAVSSSCGRMLCTGAAPS